MTELKTVDEIMALVKRYAAAGISAMPVTYDAVRAAITDLHEDARQQRARADGLEVLVALYNKSDKGQADEICTLRNHINEIEPQMKAFRSRVAELEAALRPFAEAGCFNDCRHDYDAARKAMRLEV